VGKNCRVKAFGWVQVGVGGGASQKKFDSQFWHSAKCGLPSSVMLVLLLLLVVVVVVVVVVVAAAGSLKIHSFVGPMASSSIHHMVQGVS